MQELCDIKKGRLKEIAEFNERLEFYKTMLNSYRTYSQALIDQGTDREIVRAAVNLHERAEELMISQEEHKQDRLNVTLLRFVKSFSSCADHDLKKQQLGSLVYKGNQIFFTCTLSIVSLKKFKYLFATMRLKQFLYD